MFIYKGRIYRRKHSGTCDDCVFDGDKDCNHFHCFIGDGIYKELFISRLFHAIIEVFYGEEK